MGWYRGKTTKVTMEKWDHPELFVEFKDLQSLDYGRMKKLQADYGNMDEESPDAETLNSVLNLISELIVGWNMLHPETDEVIPQPVGADGWEALPAEVITEVIAGTKLAETKDTPLEKETSPEAQPKE